jgi:hypothetical protein
MNAMQTRSFSSLKSLHDRPARRTFKKHARPSASGTMIESLENRALFSVAPMSAGTMPAEPPVQTSGIHVEPPPKIVIALIAILMG